MWSFIGERHPLPSRLALSFLVYLGPTAFAAQIHGISTALWSPTTASGTFSVFNFYLILRLSDELKDFDLDAKRFPNRPLPSGRIAPRDLHIGLIATFLATLVLNIGTTIALLGALAVLGYQLLMYKFFFMPEISRRHPLVNLITHNPVFALIPLYAVFVFAGRHGLSVSNLAWTAILPFIAMIWMPFLGWEIARKLRAPEAHDPYDIYSPALGRVGAVLSVIAAQAVALLITLYIAFSLSLTWAYSAVVVAGFALALVADIRFLIAPNERSARLRPSAEIFLAGVLAAQLVGFGTTVLRT